MKILLKNIWDRDLVNLDSTPAPLTKITKKIGNGIINTRKDTNINNQLKLFLFVYVNKYYPLKRCILWNF